MHLRHLFCTYTEWEDKKEVVNLGSQGCFQRGTEFETHLISSVLD